MDAIATSTVVITTYNRPELLRQAIASVAMQTRLPDEVIVVDDGSPDPVTVSSTLNLRVVRQDNAGLAAARNRGVIESSGGVVFFLDDDDLFAAHRVERAMAAHESAAIVVCGQTGFAGDELEPRFLTQSGVDEPTNTAGVRVASLLSATTPNFGSLSIRRADWLPLDESYRASQDIEWWVRLAEEDRVVNRVAADDLFVRRHAGVRHLNGSPARIEGSIRLLREHSAFFDTHPRARSFRLARIAVMSAQNGDHRAALAFSFRSLRTRPTRSGLRALWESVRPRSRSGPTRDSPHDLA